MSHVDLELATEHYRGDHMAAKDGAGFKIYAESGSFPRFGAGGSSGCTSSSSHYSISIFWWCSTCCARCINTTTIININ